MPKGKIQFVPLKEVFSEWTPAPFGAGRRGLVLVDDKGGLKIERSNELSGKGKIFLGEIKKPTLKVGFLNALFGERDFLEGVDQGDLENLLIPLPSRLRIEKVNNYFRVLRRLRRKSLQAEEVIKLEISQLVSKKS